MSEETKNRLRYILLAILRITGVVFLSLGLNGCTETYNVNYNQADIRRKIHEKISEY